MKYSSFIVNRLGTDDRYTVMKKHNLSVFSNSHHVVRWGVYAVATSRRKKIEEAAASSIFPHMVYCNGAPTFLALPEIFLPEWEFPAHRPIRRSRDESG